MGTTVTLVDDANVGTYTLDYSVTNTAGLANNPIHRVVNIVDTVGPVWSLPASAAQNVIEIEAATKAASIFADNKPIATDACGSKEPVVQFIVTILSPTSAEDATKFYCGLGATNGEKAASDAAEKATASQDLMGLVRACSRYNVQWDAADDAGNHVYMNQVRDHHFSHFIVYPHSRSLSQ
jgi:hypothetical protein